MAYDAYQNWKDEQLQKVLERGEISPQTIRPTYTASAHNRRRARFAYRRRADDVIIGFRQRASHHIVTPTGCIILAPEIMAVLPLLETQLLASLDQGSTGQIDINLCDNGCDVCVITDEPCLPQTITKMTTAAADIDIARLCLSEPKEDISLLIQKKQPEIQWSLPKDAAQKSVTLYPSAATFLQADSGAETIMRDDIFEALEGFDRIVDLFCGSGTLSAALLFQKEL